MHTCKFLVFDRRGVVTCSTATKNIWRENRADLAGVGRGVDGGIKPQKILLKLIYALK